MSGYPPPPPPGGGYPPYGGSDTYAYPQPSAPPPPPGYGPAIESSPPPSGPPPPSAAYGGGYGGGYGGYGVAPPQPPPPSTSSTPYGGAPTPTPAPYGGGTGYGAPPPPPPSGPGAEKQKEPEAVDTSKIPYAQLPYSEEKKGTGGPTKLAAVPGVPTYLGELRVTVKAAKKIPGDTTFFKITPYISLVVGPVKQATQPVKNGNTNPIWKPAPKFYFDVMSNYDTLIVRVWDKATSVVGTTKMKVEGAIPLEQFMDQKPVDTLFKLGSSSCEVHLKVQFVDEQVARTIHVKNLKPGSKESHMHELFKVVDGIKDVYVDSGKLEAHIEFNTRPGYMASFNLNGKFGLKVKPAIQNIEKARNPDISLKQFREDPGAAAKGLAKKGMASITGMFSKKKKKEG